MTTHLNHAIDTSFIHTPFHGPTAQHQCSDFPLILAMATCGPNGETSTTLEMLDWEETQKMSKDPNFSFPFHIFHSLKSAYRKNNKQLWRKMSNNIS